MERERKEEEEKKKRRKGKEKTRQNSLKSVRRLGVDYKGFQGF